MSLRRLTLAALPAIALLVAYGLGPDHPARLFRADLSALVIATALGAFALRERVDAAWALAGCVAAVLAHAVVAGGMAGGAVLGLLLVGCGLAAFGLARLVEALRAPQAFAGVLAFAILCAAMSGLYWADPVADELPAPDRYPFRQAALQLDPAMACAYGAARYDLLHDADVYSSVPLASSTHIPPTGMPTALLWLAVGLVSGTLGLALGAPVPKESA